MRDAKTDQMGEHLSEQFNLLDFQGKPDKFVKFACQYLGAVAPTYMLSKRGEASFVMPTGYGAMFCYYNESRDAWFAKF